MKFVIFCKTCNGIDFYTHTQRDIDIHIDTVTMFFVQHPLIGNTIQNNLVYFLPAAFAV